jgi:predicted GNAT superfamily acetyltransferase
MEISFRELKTQDDYEACVVLQRETWGENFIECVPPAILQIGQKVGGVSAGAFDKDNKMLGFVFGLTGVKGGKLIHWSHMLAVRKQCRGENIGRQLKIFQRDLLLKVGVENVYWTYDPLVAKNANINFNKLGVRVSEYVEDMYGDDSGSDLHHGIGMDRFIVLWPIADPRVDKIIAGESPAGIADFEGSLVVNTELDAEGRPCLTTSELPDHKTVRIEIPDNIETIQHVSLDLAAAWRENTKRAFLHYLRRGYEVASFYRDPESNRCFYGLIEPSRDSNSTRS